MKNKTLLIFLAFLGMGFGAVVGPQTSQIQVLYGLTTFMSGLIPFMGFIMFGLLCITIDAKPARSNKISRFMVTAIIGGGILPLFYGIVAGAFTLRAGFFVPLLAIIYILFLPFKAKVTS
ncbi:MAG: hypothetical protein ACOC0C_01725 [Bacteroidota bacterium]